MRKARIVEIEQSEEDILRGEVTEKSIDIVWGRVRQNSDKALLGGLTAFPYAEHAGYAVALSKATMALGRWIDNPLAPGTLIRARLEGEDAVHADKIRQDALTTLRGLENVDEEDIPISYHNGQPVFPASKDHQPRTKEYW